MGPVYAIEMDAEDHGLIQQNAERFGVGERERGPRPGPGSLRANCPIPTACSSPGRAAKSRRSRKAAFKRLRPGGRLVVNTTSIDHLMELRESVQQCALPTSVWMINLARGTDQLDRLSFDPLKPSFLLAVTKS